MVDISMCPSKVCSVRKTCYRNMASGTKPSDRRQSVFISAPGEDFNCVYYWPIGDIQVQDNKVNTL